MSGVPTFIIQGHNDALTKSSDVQQIFDNLPVIDKISGLRGRPGAGTATTIFQPIPSR
jgi:hypothetical protein